MRRIIIIVVVGILIIFALTRVLSKKKPAGSMTSQKTAGKTAGAVRPKTKQEIAAEQKRTRTEERKRQQELQRQKRAEEHGKRLSTRNGRLGSGRKEKVSQFYQVRAIMTVGSESYVLIDERQYAKGDDIMGRRIIDILSDRIIVDEGGQRREVKIGESVLPIK